MLRAATPGIVVAAVGALAVVVVDRLPDETRVAVLAGAGLAALTGAVGASLKAAAVFAPLRDAARPAATGLASPAQSGLQLALFGDFTLQLFTVGIAMLGMHFAGLKFPVLVGFALAFATVALAHQFGSALVLWRTLRRRAAHGAVPGGASPLDGDARPSSASGVTAPAQDVAAHDAAQDSSVTTSRR